MKPTAPFDVDRIRAQLAGSRFRDVRYVAQTGSTNSDAQALLGDSHSLGATLVAEYQSAGIGRKGRSWFAPPGSALLFTAILPDPIATSALWAVPFWTALGVAAAVEQYCGVNLDLVWPNDLHASGGGKVAGVLSVARIIGDDARIGCGVGLNVHCPLNDADLDALDPQPVFLDQQTQNFIDRAELLVAILREFNDTLSDFTAPREIAARWEQRARLRQTTYRYRNDADGIEREGRAQRLGPHGALIVSDAGGETTIHMADVRIIARER